MHILCPHCHNPIEIVKLHPREEIACPSCGSSFHLDAGSTTGWERPTGLKFGKFEILETVGQGAFGTVYKARDPQLDRVVAVKVPRAGNLAGPEELDRFLREARSVAQLRHPAIVPVHDVGQMDGVPYLVSDFVEGITLSDLLSARRPGFREAAQLIATVADALHYAHERGVVHRDVKPSNIMIGKDGAAFVMDFGLAKREAGEITMTVEGQVLGTPAYMPPEQARGEGHAVDARGDVYSLGVVLYLLLTGELPFRGTTRMLLHQVLHDEPRSPRSLNDRIPRDLETIALKAMAKEPGRRYATARELADDLRRWSNGEAIRARPVGRTERVVRWVKRNPAVATSVTTVVLVLVAATTISTLFGMDSANKAEVARNEKAGAVAARNALAKKNTDLEKTQDELEGALARTWLSPLAETSGPLNDAEIGAFTALAANRDERLAERFVKEALRDRHGIRQLGARSAYVVHAAVGLDAHKRQEVERLLFDALDGSDLSEESRTDLALAAAQVGELYPPVAAVVAKTLLSALDKTTDPLALGDLVQSLSAAIIRLEAKDAARVSAEAAALVLKCMSKNNDREAQSYLEQALSVALARMEPGEAAAVLRQAMTDHIGTDALAHIASAVAARMEPREAVPLLVQAMTTYYKVVGFTSWQGLGTQALDDLTGRLSAVVAGMEPPEAFAAAALITQALTDGSGGAQNYLAKALAVAAARMEPKDAARACALAATKITKAMIKHTVSFYLQPEIQPLSVLAVWMEPKDAAAVAILFTQAMTETTNVEHLADLAHGLSAVAVRLDPKEAGRVSAEAADLLMRALTHSSQPSYLRSAAKGLSAITARMKPKDAARVSAQAAAVLQQEINQTNDPQDLKNLVEGLSAVADGMEPLDAARVSAQAAGQITHAMTVNIDAIQLQPLTEALTLLVARMEPREAARVSREAAAQLLQSLATNTNAFYLRSMAERLSALTVRMDAKEAGRVSAQAAALLIQALIANADPSYRRSVTEGLSAVAAHMEPNEAARKSAEAATQIVQAMTKTTRPDDLLNLAKGLSAVAAWMEPGDAARVSAQAAAWLAQAMTKTTDHYALVSLVRALSAVSARVATKESAQAAALLGQAMTKTTDAFALESLVQGLSILANQMEPREAARVFADVAALLTHALNKVAEFNQLKALAQGLALVLGAAHADKRAKAIAATVGGLQECVGLPGTLLLLRPAIEPFPRHLSDQELVELLKHPLCVGPARRAVLDHLGIHYRRTFADQWEFVRFAEEQKLGLDFIMPPKRQ